MVEVKAGYEILDDINGKAVLGKLERIARVCYKSEDKIGEGTDWQVLHRKVHVSVIMVLEEERLRLSDLYICQMTERITIFGENLVKWPNSSIWLCWIMAVLRRRHGLYCLTVLKQRSL